ncbi:serine hydrolase [Chitinophaga sp. 30R24]|uniref:serine hydrolase n=1 Tax=Chitinophaga sp. 30R24 TaxID=3248838 RepID=UPI003B915F75
MTTLINKWFSCLCCLIIMAGAQAQVSVKGNKLGNIDTTLTRILQQEHGAGFAVAVVEKGQVIFSKGYGYRDLANKLPVTPNTQFAIGSCTKAFTGALLGNLRKQGKVDFDKPATTYVPALDFINPDLNHEITLRDMMCHRTGFARYDFAWYLFTTASRDTLLKRMHYMEPSAPLRMRWQYNNFMFMVQGMAAEQITGQSWEQNIVSQFFKPLGMDHSSLDIAALAAGTEPSLGYILDKNKNIKLRKYHYLGAMGPAGAINSSVTDMSKWLITWINGGTYNGKEIIPSDYVKEAISSQMVIDAGFPSAAKPDIQFANYGLGWMMFSYHGHYRVEHGGNIDGFSALTTFYPTDSIGIVVLSNQHNSPIPTKVINALSDKLLGIVNNDKPKKEAPGKDEEIKRIKDSAVVHPITHPLADFAGVFTNDLLGSFEVMVQRDSLFARFPYDVWYLEHQNYDIFSPYEVEDTGIDTTEKSSVKLQFLMNNIGDIDHLSFSYDPASQPTIFNRMLKSIAIPVATLEQYVGTYKIGEMTLAVKLSDGKILHLIVPGQPIYTLEALDMDQFHIKELKDFKIKFVRDNQQQVVALISTQPNGNFRAERVVSK